MIRNLNSQKIEAVPIQSCLTIFQTIMPPVFVSGAREAPVLAVHESSMERTVI
jgi:hypothetical protein